MRQQFYLKTIYPTITDKVAVITGGAKGIGGSIARRFSAMGYNVVISYKNSKLKALSLIKELSQFGVRAVAVCADLATEKGARILRDRVIEEFGKIDVLINNAGTAWYSLLVNMSEKEIDSVLSDNLKSCIYTSKAFYDDFAFSKTGSIVNISSVWGIKGSSMETVYSSAKAGIIGFTKALAKELAPCGIRVNAIAPGIIDTDMISSFSEQEISEMTKEIPCGRIGAPDDVANVALFLASDLASYITGEVINVSGGYVI